MENDRWEMLGGELAAMRVVIGVIIRALPRDELTRVLAQASLAVEAAIPAGLARLSFENEIRQFQRQAQPADESGT